MGYTSEKGKFLISNENYCDYSVINQLYGYFITFIIGILYIKIVFNK